MTRLPSIGRELRATYAFAGARAELERTAPLDAGEDVLLHGAMRLRGVGMLPRPVVLRVTAQRLTVLAHYAFRSDRLWDLPRGAVRSAELVRGAVDVTWVCDQAGRVAVLKLTGWTGRAALDSPLRDVASVADVLLTWLDSPNGRLSLPHPPSHRR